MDFPLSRMRAARFEYLSAVGSTNDELVRLAVGSEAADWPDFSVVVTDNQTAGRGRLGREWVAPAGRSLAVSVLLRFGPQSRVEVERAGWIPLLAGLAMTRTVAAFVANGVTLKWPNDVLIDGLKVSGILAELLMDRSGVVVGSGINLALERKDLPTPTSTSLLLAGVAEPAPDAVLARYLDEFGSLRRALADDDPGMSARLAAEVSAACGTIGRAVRVELPSGNVLRGTATAIDADGRLLVETNTGITAVAAGDVTHLRY